MRAFSFIGQMCVIASLFLFPLSTCSKNHDQKSYVDWGHFKELDAGGASNANLKGAFLFQWDKNQQLKVCLPNTGPAKLDTLWVQAEIVTAINVWGFQGNRFLEVVFVPCSDSPQLIVSFQNPPTPQKFVGYTEFGSGPVPSSRTVYLNPSYLWELSADTQRWRASPDIFSAPWKQRVSFLLRLVLEGNLQPVQFPKTSANLEQSKQPLLAVLMHELGHAWGMCDMYEDGPLNDGFHSNCSTVQKGNKATEDEIMGVAVRPGKAKFRLSLADIQGIKSIFSRTDIPKPTLYGRDFLSSPTQLTVDQYMELVGKWENSSTN